MPHCIAREPKKSIYAITTRQVRKSIDRSECVLVFSQPTPWNPATQVRAPYAMRV
jgi:hypothetical protein